MPIRQAIVAGRFYPAEASALMQEVHTHLVPEEKREPALMAMLPHAGYIFCGEVLGATLARITLPSTLVLLGPNHTGRGAPLSVWPEGQWLTPLGPVEVHSELAAALIGSGVGFQPDTQAHAFEHSLEVLLPFLQVHTPGLRIVPIAVAGLSMPQLQRAGQALAAAMQQEDARRGTGQDASRSVGMVVSSDMNHFANHEQTVQLDKMALEQLLRMDEQALAATVHREKISMCGIHPACLALSACRAFKAQESVFVKHTTSGAVSGDLEKVVGYAGVYVRDYACQKVTKGSM